jgi:ATP-dependent Clp protease adaptor protein ClpS
MAIEKLNMAAMAAQPKVISMMGSVRRNSVASSLPSLRRPSSGTVMVVTSPTSIQERQQVREPYPHFRVIVLDDSVNTFQHVVEALVRHIPGMNPDRAWALAQRIDGEGSAVVWSGPQEQAELYHQLLGAEGLTMAPLERA